MRKTLIALGLALVACPVGIVATSTAANAAPSNRQNCVSKAEFRKFDTGDTLAQVRSIAGTRGRTTSSNVFSDGDTWRSVNFRQCGKSWNLSSISVSFESTETEEWVSDWYCDEYSGCEDWGYYETVYRNPLVVTSKSAWF
jgi:hypothetical protein